ncbi:MAG: diguanylate cyclase, partial [Actinomycetota bacterium]|nr:diguanylate cyclase [Actinomycetota bacterium]
AAALAQAFVVVTPRDQAYHTTAVFLLAAALLLPIELIPLVAVVAHVPEWLKERYRWYIQTFNIANCTLSMLAASAAGRLVLHAGGRAGSDSARLALAGVAAALTLIVLNHVILAPMLRFARGHSLRETGLFSLESLSTDLVLAGLGVVVACSWKTNAWLVPIALTPLLLIHRSLAVPRLQEEARVDPKTGLFNARHFAAQLREELARATRFGRPLSVIVADLDLLREINNTYGHLAGDTVLQGVAATVRGQLRDYDVAARFGGEEFAFLLPETSAEQALEIAERIRSAVELRSFSGIQTSSDPIRATISLGVASFPMDGTDANDLIHHADLAVYRAKLQGRNRVVAAGDGRGTAAAPPAPAARVRWVSDADHEVVALPRPEKRAPREERRRERPRAVPAPRVLAFSPVLVAFVALVGGGGIAAGLAALLVGSSTDVAGIVVAMALVAVAQALALAVEQGSISVSAVGAVSAAALFGGRAALPVAVAIAAVEWSARRAPLHQVVFNVGVLSLATLAAAGVFDIDALAAGHAADLFVAGAVAGGAYFLVNTGLLSLGLGLEGHERWGAVWQERFAWLLPHYVGYGVLAGAIAMTYSAASIYALPAFVVPLLLMRKTQAAYLSHAQRSAEKLREANETIHAQNASLEQANQLLRERSMAAMESLAATVDARDAYTAGHARRVQALSLAIGRHLGLSQGELDVLGHAALFHDIGKLAVPDAILLKPAALTEGEWAVIRRHADEGARIIERLGFLGDAVPAIRHHHERYDGSGYLQGMRGDRIPLGARIIHLADALDSMLSTRTYRSARSLDEALEEIRRGTGSQFCPRCVDALERALAATELAVPPALAEATA